MVESLTERGWPGGSLVIDRHRLDFGSGYPNSGYGQTARVERGDVETIVVRRQRAVPLVRETIITVRLNDGSYFPKLFKPFRSRATIASLKDSGWPIEDGDAVGWTDMAVGPVP